MHVVLAHSDGQNVTEIVAWWKGFLETEKVRFYVQLLLTIKNFAAMVYADTKKERRGKIEGSEKIEEWAVVAYTSFIYQSNVCCR